jgi:predicted phage terminase large subunit-like protein
MIGSKYVEDRANGAAIVSVMNKLIGGFIPVNPLGNKFARAQSVIPWIESGNVYLPNPNTKVATGEEDYLWVNEFVEECASFPFGAHDDDVDMMSQALYQLIYRPADMIKNTLPIDPIFGSLKTITTADTDEFMEQITMLAYTGQEGV